VDASGDDDLVYLAGAKIVKGRENNGAFMPGTLGFAVANVDTAIFFIIYKNIRTFSKIYLKKRNKTSVPFQYFISLIRL
jgi:hypothetical protein